jgi:hypothetical protein
VAVDVSLSQSCPFEGMLSDEKREVNIRFNDCVSVK